MVMNIKLLLIALILIVVSMLSGGCSGSTNQELRTEWKAIHGDIVANCLSSNARVSTAEDCERVISDLELFPFPSELVSSGNLLIRKIQAFTESHEGTVWYREYLIPLAQSAVDDYHIGNTWDCSWEVQFGDGRGPAWSDLLDDPDMDLPQEVRDFHLLQCTYLELLEEEISSITWVLSDALEVF